MRPLQLVDSTSSPTTSSPLSPPLSAPTTTTSFRRAATARRQSSISYTSRPAFAPSRSNSICITSREKEGLFPSRRKSVDQNLTLVEKHADLLHFIAQKESKCMELRAQLASEEEELLVLKRKWERIVGRGVGIVPSYSAEPLAAPATSLAQAAIKEGVRILSGLNNLPTTPTTTQPSGIPADPPPGHQTSARVLPHYQRLARFDKSRQSVSSVSTQSGSDTSVSLSSTSSVNDTDDTSITESPNTSLASIDAPAPSSPKAAPRTPPPNSSSLPKPSPSPAFSFPAPSQRPAVPLVAPPSLTSWVGQVSKKLNQLQKGHQKRASTLLSDVSSSFLTAVAQAQTIIDTSMKEFAEENSYSPVSTNVSPLTPNNKRTSPIIQSASVSPSPPLSLIDEDDSEQLMSNELTLEPDSLYSPISQPNSNGSPTGSSHTPTPLQDEVIPEDDDEWGW